MTPFTHGEITRLRFLRRTGRPMLDIVARLNPHARDEVVEAIDATIRHQHDGDAMRHVNQVLAYQEAGIQLVNGRPMGPLTRYHPMF